MEEIRVTFENDGMQFEVTVTPEHYAQAVGALILQGFEHLDGFDKLYLAVFVDEAIRLYREKMREW